MLDLEDLLPCKYCGRLVLAGICCQAAVDVSILRSKGIALRRALLDLRKDPTANVEKVIRETADLKES